MIPVFSINLVHKTAQVKDKSEARSELTVNPDITLPKIKIPPEPASL